MAGVRAVAVAERIVAAGAIGIRTVTVDEQAEIGGEPSAIVATVSEVVAATRGPGPLATGGRT